MLLQWTFALKKKYSKYHLWNFWTKSSLSQGETQNPAHAESSHSLLFIPSCHVLLVINNVLFIRHRARLNHELFSSFWQTISPSYLCPHFVSSKTLSQKIMNFWNISYKALHYCIFLKKWVDCFFRLFYFFICRSNENAPIWNLTNISRKRLWAFLEG